MNIKLQPEREIKQKALDILWQTMEPPQLVLLISQWFSDEGDSLKVRDRIFEGETVSSLAKKIRTMQEQSNSRLINNPSIEG
jgi:hypothetical protein